MRHGILSISRLGRLLQNLIQRSARLLSQIDEITQILDNFANQILDQGKRVEPVVDGPVLPGKFIDDTTTSSPANHDARHGAVATSKQAVTGARQRINNIASPGR